MRMLEPLSNIGTILLVIVLIAGTFLGFGILPLFIGGLIVAYWFFQNLFIQPSMRRSGRGGRLFWRIIMLVLGLGFIWLLLQAATLSPK